MAHSGFELSKPAVCNCGHTTENVGSVRVRLIQKAGNVLSPDAEVHKAVEEIRAVARRSHSDRTILACSFIGFSFQDYQISHLQILNMFFRLVPLAHWAFLGYCASLMTVVSPYAWCDPRMPERT